MQCCPYEALAQTVEAKQVKLLREEQGSWLHERPQDAASAVNDYKPRVMHTVAIVEDAAEETLSLENGCAPLRIVSPREQTATSHQKPVSCCYETPPLIHGSGGLGLVVGADAVGCDRSVLCCLASCNILGCSDCDGYFQLWHRRHKQQQTNVDIRMRLPPLRGVDLRGSSEVGGYAKGHQIPILTA